MRYSFIAGAIIGHAFRLLCIIDTRSQPTLPDEHADTKLLRSVNSSLIQQLDRVLPRTLTLTLFFGASPGVVLFSAFLPGVVLFSAFLPSGILFRAFLPGVVLFNAFLPGVVLFSAFLPSGILFRAFLPGVVLFNAFLPSGILFRASSGGILFRASPSSILFNGPRHRILPIKPSSTTPAAPGTTEYPHSDVTTTYITTVTGFVPCSTSVGHNEHSVPVYSTYLTASYTTLTVTSTIHGCGDKCPTPTPETPKPTSVVPVHSEVTPAPGHPYPAVTQSVYPADVPHPAESSKPQPPAVSGCPAPQTVTKTEIYTVTVGNDYSTAPAGPVTTIVVTEAGHPQTYTVTLPGPKPTTTAEGPKPSASSTKTESHGAQPPYPTSKPHQSATPSVGTSMSYEASSAPYPTVKPSSGTSMSYETSSAPYPVHTPSSSSVPVPSATSVKPTYVKPTNTVPYPTSTPSSSASPTPQASGYGAAYPAGYGHY
ncbi:hypothetical protein PTNB85_10289 [Pyrenophora teres f. teres]|nr:hypothetical protein PTNB85_10289 [Pyrenophora teres f. teres]KAE8823228.1 hypothetical protein HRS9139_09637 [Pyrenophora teres f. teres]KAE8854400.1 hypothetical protein PTNB29_09756 [Pyrenophora teres f. teres]